MSDALENYEHQPYYCEENIYRLLSNPELADLESWVCFISNPSKTLLMWNQRAAGPGRPILWDYHVVALARRDDSDWEVWDLDTRVGMPIPLAKYLNMSFVHLALPSSASVSVIEDLAELARKARPDLLDRSSHAWVAPHFRVCRGTEFLEKFASDRRHMLDAEGNYLHEPPPWPAPGQGSNLDAYVNVEAQGPGQVFDWQTIRDGVEAL